MDENKYPVDFSNKIQNQLVFDLYCYSNYRIEVNREMIFKTYPSELITKTLNEYRIFFNSEYKFYKILTENDHQESKMTLVHFFTALNDYKIVDYLVKYKPDLEITTNFFNDTDNVYNVTALWIAAYCDSKQIMEILLKNGANPNAVNHNLSSPLRLFAFDNILDSVKLFLQYNADVNKGNNLDNTPLMLAASKGHYEIVSYLLENGADPNLAAKCGNTALHFATKFNHFDIVKLLINFKAKFQKNSYGLTPLFVAAYNGLIDFVNYFISLPNLVTLKDQIIAHELLSCSYFLSDIDYEEDDDEEDDDEDEFVVDYNEISLSLKRAFLLRNTKILLKTSNVGPFKPLKLNFPYHRKPILPGRPEFLNIKETETLTELCALDNGGLILESFFVLERFFGEFSFKTANALMALYEAPLKSELKYLTFKKAIEIKLQLKLFVGSDILAFIEHFRSEFPDLWLEVIQFAIKYFKSISLPQYRELPFQINLNGCEYFTQNDVKVDKIIDINENKKEAQNDIQKIVYGLVITFKHLSRDFIKFDIEKQDQMKKAIRELSKLNFFDYYGRSLMHIVLSASLYINVNFQTIKTSALFLLFCGVNTTVYDYAYNTPLHYLAYSAAKEDASLRLVKPIYKKLMNYSYQGIYNKEAFHHFDYAGQNKIHFDAVNIFNSTAYDIFPSLKYFESDIKINIKLAPLKCLAARQAHKALFRCPECRYLSMYNYNDRFIYDVFSKTLRLNYFELFRNHYFFANLFNISNKKGHSLMYSEKASYCDHCPRNFDPEIWKLSKIFAKQLNISEKLLEFIEMHGPCKIIHYLPVKFNNCLSDFYYPSFN